MRKVLVFTFPVLILMISTAYSQTMMDLSTIDLGIQQIRENTFLIQSINQTSSMTMDRGGKGSSGRPKQPRPSPVGGSAGGTVLGTTTFKPVAPNIVPKRWAASMGRTASERLQLEKFFLDLLDEYKKLAVAKGAPLNDVARALSYDLGNSYDVYNEGSVLDTRAFEAMRRQVYDSLRRSTNFQALDDRKKQEMYESYIIIGAFVDTTYQTAIKSNNMKLVSKMRDLGRGQLEGIFGVPFAQLRFTDAGVQY